MKRSIAILTVLFLSVGIARAQRFVVHPTADSLILMPWPRHIELMNGKFRLKRNLTVSVAGNPAPRMYDGATRFLRQLQRMTGLFLTQASVTPADTSSYSSFAIHVNRPGKVQLGEDESYSLEVTPDRIELKAEDDIGALHGLQTLRQLIMADNYGYYIPAVKIEDAPRFKWRGLMIDVGRHFMPVDVIKRNLNAMAAVKLNVFHWHLTEDQGFRVQCKTFPKLYEDGSNGQYYTQQQIKDIIKYANDRGIRVVPEFDMPGHTTSWFVGYPQYASAPGPYKIEDHFGVFNPVFDPTNNNTYKFLDKFFKEMTALFPDPYMHIGGDENNGVQWSKNPHIQKFMKEHNMTSSAQLQTYFINKVSHILQKYGKKTIGWDEILEPGVPQSAVIESWRGKESLYKAAKEGHGAILASGYYIDLLRPASHHYLNDPIPPDQNLPEAVKKNILGGEATMWSELVTPFTIDSRIWPRTAAIAERLWSPDSINNVHFMYERLPFVSRELEFDGTTQIKNQIMLLRHLAGREHIGPLKKFVDVIEPLKGYRRNQNDQYTTHSPFTMIADAAVADAPDARHFRDDVSDYLAGKETDAMETKIRDYLSGWISNTPGLIDIVNKAPDLHDIRPMVENLKSLSEVGLEAMDTLKSGITAKPAWALKAQKVIDDAQQSYGKTQIMVVSAVEQLVKKAAGSEIPAESTPSN